MNGPSTPPAAPPTTRSLSQYTVLSYLPHLLAYDWQSFAVFILCVEIVYRDLVHM